MAGVPYEYFHPRHWESWTTRLKNGNSLYAFRMLCQLRSTSNGVFGVKAHWHQFSNAIKMDLEQDLKSAGFIYLTREALLDQAISHRIALQTGVWMSGQKQTGNATFSFAKVAESLKLILQERDNWERFFAYTGIVPYRLTYEALLQNVDGEMRALCDHLGIAWSLNESLAPRVQRGELNIEWREKFLHLAKERFDVNRFWAQEFTQ